MQQKEQMKSLAMGRLPAHLLQEVYLKKALNFDSFVMILSHLDLA